MSGRCSAHLTHLLGALPLGAKLSDVGRAARADGISQLTYNGHPLYTFMNDKRPGFIPKARLSASAVLRLAGAASE